MILQHCDIDVSRVDKWGRTALDVSSPNCRHLLQPYGILTYLLCFINPPPWSGEGIIEMHFLRQSVRPSFRNILCPLYNLRMH